MSSSLLLLAALASPAAQAAGASASSTGESDAGRHPAALAVDGLLQTGWSADREQDSAGQWLELDLGTSTELTSISLWPGNISQGKRSFREYARPKLVRVLVDGQEVAGPVRLQDRVERVDIPVEATGRKVRIVVDEAFNGYVFDQLFITEVAVNFPELGVRGEKWRTWLDSDAAKKQQEKYQAELFAQYDAYKAQEFGDREALAWIMDAAAEGAPYVRAEALRRVPVGFRAQAIPSSDKARTALRKLKDANAIPALEMAMLRTTGRDAAQIQETVQIFTAYQEMIGNQGRTAPPWGESGFWRGALRSFGEPLAIERDSDGNLYVADTGNNRVQRFGDNGLVNGTWGPQPELASTWFEEGRPWYVSGSEPGDSPGRFENPLDIELIPAKEGSGFAVLDATGRVQIYDESGGYVTGWTTDLGATPDPKVGGEGYLAFNAKKDKLYVFLEDQAAVYDMTGTQLDSWEIQDGTPGAVEILPNGRLLLAFRGEIVRYDDGFRHSTLIDEDILGRGFEDLDMTLDQDGKLWVLTDDGMVHKFKKPGKLDYQVVISSYSLSNPRLAVYDEMVWFTNDDSIREVDAAQIWMDAQAGEQVQADELDL